MVGDWFASEKGLRASVLVLFDRLNEERETWTAESLRASGSPEPGAE